MESKEVVIQLSTFASNLVDVVNVLRSLSESCGGSNYENTVSQMNEAKSSLLDTLTLLNTILVAQDSVKQVYSIYPGSLVLAPRLFQGCLCWDFAIVTQITENRRPMLTATSTTQTLDQYSLQDCEPCSESEVAISVTWLRPQTLYEHFSHNITFAPSQLREPHVAVQYWQEQEAALSIVRVGDDVLYLNTDCNSSSGVWHLTKVNSVQAVEQTEATLTIIPLNTRNTAVKQQTPIELPLSMSKVTLLPRRASDGAHSCVSSSQPRCTVNTPSVPTNSLYSDLESDTEDNLYAGITSLPSYADRHTSKNASSASLSTLAGPPGTWEKHTKGFGSKVMARMGYKQSSGKGLGKHAQGIIAPIEGLIKALPAGLSLDYINEVTATRGHNKNVTGVGAEEALEQHKSDIKLDIVARFNAAQRAAAPKVKVKPHKLSAASVTKPVRENNTFEFLNTMEINRRNSSSNAPTAAVVNANNAKKASAHRNPNMNKLF